MIIPEGIPIFGDVNYRNKKAPKETIEQITYVNYVRKNMPDIGAVLIHVKNEGKKNNKQVMKDKVEGMVTGASDISCPGKPSLTMEIKRADHTLSTISDEQVKYLLAAQKLGSFACIALGYKGALEATEAWLNETR